MTPDGIRHFLVTYDIPRGRADVEAFDDYDEALAAYASLERKTFQQSDVEVVLLGADSIETVKRTHSSYFETRLLSFEELLDDVLRTR